MNIYSLLALIAGIMIGANIGFIIAGLFWRADDGEDVFDK